MLPIDNVLLRSLNAFERTRLEPFLEPVFFERDQVLQTENEMVETVWFPDDGLLSSQLSSIQGVGVVMGLTGKTGCTGIGAALAERTSPMTTLVQVAGSGWSLPAEMLCQEFECSPHLRKVLLRHLDLATVQASQCSLCNRLHTVQERLSGWLLTISDHLASSHFNISIDFVAALLGNRHSSVPLALGVLQQVGLIWYEGEYIEILKRHELEQASCPCYFSLRDRLGMVHQCQLLAA